MREYLKLLACVILCTSLLVSSTSIQNLSMSTNSSIVQSTNELATSHILHDYIFIMDDTEFASQASAEGWQGDGSEANPYIIEGYHIDSGAASGITLYATTAYYIIRDCIISNCNYWGIWLQGPNGIVTNCTIYGSENDGIYLDDVADIDISNCTIFNNGGHGIYLSGSSSITIHNISIPNSFYYGLRISGGSSNIVSNLTITDVVDGVSISSAANCQVSNCTMTCSGPGIYVSGGTNITLLSNTISMAGEEGISFSADNSRIANNTILSTDNDGIGISSDNSLIANNTVVQCGKAGMTISSSTNLTIKNNDFQTHGLELLGTTLQTWLHDFEGNDVQGKEIKVILNQTNLGLDGSNYGQIILVNCEKVNVTGGTFTDLAMGPAAAYCRNCTFKGMEVKNSKHGIYSYFSENCSFVDNVITSGGVLVQGSTLAEWFHVYSGNLVNGKPLGIFTSLSETTIDTAPFGQIIVSNCSSVILQNAQINGTSSAVSFAFSNSCMLEDSRISNTTYYGIYTTNTTDCHFNNCTIEQGDRDGIRIYLSQNCTITNSSVSNQALPEYGNGVIFSYSHNSRVIHSNFSYCYNGVYVYHSNSCIIEDVFNYKNKYGIYGWEAHELLVNDSYSLNSTESGINLIYSLYVNLIDSRFVNNTGFGGYISGYYVNVTHCIFDNNGDDGFWASGSNFTFTYCEFTKNENRGLYLHYRCVNCTVFGNLFKENKNSNAYCYSSPNQWDNGFDLGNWWDDLLSTDPYLISGPAGVYDNYPMGPMNIEDESNVQYHVPISGRSITWSAYSAIPHSYVVLLDDVEIDANTWDGSSVTVPIQDGLPIGVYNYTLVLNETGGDWVSDYVLVTVYDNLPTITHHDDIEVLFSTNWLTFWYASDTNPSKFIIYRNSSEVDSGIWDGERLDVYLNPPALGVYNYTLFVNDTSGQFTTDTFYATVIDPVPIINDAPNLEYYVGTTGNFIHWNVTDQNPTTYEIYKDSELLESDTWTGDYLNFSIDGLNVGEYNYTIIVYDESSNYASDTVVVTVVDSDPEINSPSDIEYSVGTTGHNITWMTSDTNPSEFTLYRNGTEIDSGVWNQANLYFSVDGLSVGNYNYTLVITDTNGNSVADTVFVIVIAETTTTNNTTTSTNTTTTYTSITDTTTPTDPDNFDIMSISVLVGIGALLVVIVLVLIIMRKR